MSQVRASQAICVFQHEPDWRYRPGAAGESEDCTRSGCMKRLLPLRVYVCLSAAYRNVYPCAGAEEAVYDDEEEGVAERDEVEEVDDDGDNRGLGLRARRSGPVSKAVAAAQGQLLGSVDNVSGLLPGDSDAPDDMAAGDDELLSEARADPSACIVQLLGACYLQCLFTRYVQCQHFCAVCMGAKAMIACMHSVSKSIAQCGLLLHCALLMLQPLQLLIYQGRPNRNSILT